MSNERDIVERLRDHWGAWGSPPATVRNQVVNEHVMAIDCNEAAATIELLRAEVNARRYREKATFLTDRDLADREVRRAKRATDAAGALGKEAGNGK